MRGGFAFLGNAESPRRRRLYSLHEMEYAILYRRYGKRAVDLLLTVPAVVLLAPLLASVATLVRVRLGSPVLFRQERPGLSGRAFTILKFRTMTDGRDAEGNLLPDEVRLTTFGRFLRSSSLDELPELFNVIRGDMSLVGPRPLLMRYLDRYTPDQMRRHEVRPGITGWAQVNGRAAIGYEERFVMDAWYVDNLSLRLDLRILARTALGILKREGITREGYATGPEFMGSGHEPDGGRRSETAARRQK